MAISEGVANSVVIKPHTSGVFATTEPVLATDPGASGGQTLRRTTANINLTKSTFASQEVNSSRQVVDMRHGTRRVEGTIAGEISAQTYFDYLVATHRDVTPSGSFTALTQTTYTSISSSGSASTITLGAADPVATGLLKVGDVITISGLTAGNIGLNTPFVCLGFGGTTNRTITVSPAPTVDVAAATTFSIARTGRSTVVPTSGHIQRAYAIEVVDPQLDISRMFSQVRFCGYSISCPSEGMATISFDVAGRNMSVLTGASSPFFTSPTGQTSTGIAAAANGVLRVNGTNVAVVTGLDLQYKMEVTSPSVVGSGIVPDVLLGPSVVTGNLNAFLQDSSLIALFTAETAFELIISLPTSDGYYVVLYMPRVKVSGANVDLGDGAQTISMPFQALQYGGSTTNGQVATTIRITDSAAP